MPNLPEHLAPLESWFAECPGALVAYSAGVDSSVVAYAAFRVLGSERMRAVMTASASLKRRDLAEGERFCAQHGIPLKIIETQELENSNYAANPNNRCYFCKSTLYADMQALQKHHPGWWLMNGQNLDDAGDYRPGIQAADEHTVRRPLVDAGIDKNGVRALAKHWALNCWDKPASPCLSSRIPYGQTVTLEKLQRIEQAETLLEEQGFAVCRVRHDQNTARIEVPQEELPRLQSLIAALTPAMNAMGFASVVIDDEGFVSGKLNRAIVGLTVGGTGTP